MRWLQAHEQTQKVLGLDDFFGRVGNLSIHITRRALGQLTTVLRQATKRAAQNVTACHGGWHYCMEMIHHICSEHNTAVER